MVGTAFADQFISKVLIAFALYQFLQLRLIIVRLDHIRKMRQNQPRHNSLCCLKAAVKIRSGDQRLHDITENTCTIAAAGLFFAMSEQQGVTQMKITSYFRKCLLADQLRTNSCQLSLVLVRKGLIKIIRRNKAEDRIA